MNQAEKAIGKTSIHPELGKVEVIGTLRGSRTRVEIKCVQRAEGWDEDSKSYRPIKKFIPNLDAEGNKVGMTFTRTLKSERNDQHGHIDECHINELEIL